MQPARFSFLTLVFVPCLVGQTPISPRGMLASEQIGLVFNRPSDATVANMIIRRHAGSIGDLTTFAGSGLPSPYGPVPEYTTDAIEFWIAQQIGAPNVEPLLLDAMSTGNDLIPVRFYPATTQDPPRYRIMADALNTWAGMFLSISGTTSAGTSPLQGLSEYGAGIIGHYFDTSVPMTFAGSTMFEQGYADFFSPPSSPFQLTSGDDIVALDVAMGSIVANRGRQQDSIIENTTQLFFSVTPDCAELIELNSSMKSLLDVGGAGTTITGGTVFVATYGDGAVIQVRVDKHYDDLQLDLGENLDALGVGRTIDGQTGNGNGAYIIYTLSTEGVATQIEMVGFDAANGAMTTARGPALTENQLPLQTAFGLPTEGVEIDGLCDRDPEFLMLAETYGTPSDLLGPASSMPLSIFLEDVGGLPAGHGFPQAPQIVMNGVLSGWGGGAVAESYVVARLIGQDDSSSASFVEFFVLPNRQSSELIYGFTLPFVPEDLPTGYTYEFSVGMATVNPYQANGESWKTYFRR